MRTGSFLSYLPGVARRVMRIDANELEDVECSAMIMALMAFPGEKDEAKREDAFNALVARSLYESNRLERDTTPFLNPRLNAYLRLKSESDSSTVSRRVGKILGARSEVARIAAPWILELWTDNYPDLPAMAEPILKDRVNNLLGRDPDMWIRRKWRPAKPAFHLFAAYFVAALILPAEAKDPFNSESAEVRAPDSPLTPVVGRLAMSFQEKLVRDRRFKFRREDLVWLDWQEAAEFATNR